MHGESVDEIERKLQIETEKLQQWCISNGMQINIVKTKSMLIGPKSNHEKIKVKIEDECIECVNSFKYLGLILDGKLSFDEHFEEVCKNMASRVYLINRQKRNFSSKWRHIIATSLIISKMDYCLPIWGDVPLNKVKRINTILLRAAKKVVLRTSRKHKKSKIDHLEQLGWLMFHEKVDVYMLNFVFKYIWTASPLQKCFPHFKKGKQPEEAPSKKTILSFLL